MVDPYIHMDSIILLVIRDQLFRLSAAGATFVRKRPEDAEAFPLGPIPQKTQGTAEANDTDFRLGYHLMYKRNFTLFKLECLIRWHI